MSDGLCQCGCGEPAPLAKKTITRMGWKKGEPKRFRVGHNRRKSKAPYIEDPDTGCWIWQRNKLPSGYSQAWDGEKVCYGHRLYYEQHKGPIPEGLQIDHLCRNPSCVNPDHLEVVTPAENSRRGRNTKLTAEQVAEIRTFVPSTYPWRKDFAAQYGVSPKTIDVIRCGYGWADVQPQKEAA